MIRFTPLPYVTDIGKIDSRLVAVGGEDFTIRRGTAAGAPRRRTKNGKWTDNFALEYESSLVYFADGSGASVRSVEHEQGGHLPSSDEPNLRNT